MKHQWLALLFVVLSLTAVAIGLVGVADLSGSVWAASAEQAPTIVEISPSAAPNDLDTSIVITGTSFAAVPTVTLGNTLLHDIGWVNSTTLTATIPWGLNTGTYTMTIANPDGITGTLPNAFTVTQGIGVWNTGGLYGGVGRQVVINPITPAMLYATSEDVGVFRSNDAAGTWTFAYANPVGFLSVDPVSGSHIYLAAYPHAGGSFYRSDDEGSTWIPLTTTFPATTTVIRDCWGGQGIVAHPSSSGTVYAYACDTGDGRSGLLRSTNWDGEWVPAMRGLTDTQVTALAFHPDDPDIMVLGTASGNVFRTIDGGAGWTHASAPVEYVGMLAVNPFNPDQVWVGAQDVFTGPCGLLKSANADLTAWTAMELAPGEPICAESAIRFAPQSWGETYSGTLFVAGHGNLYRTSDGGSTWAPFGDGGGIHDIALHPTGPTTIYLAHYRDAVHKTTDGGASWQPANQGLTAIFPWQLAAVPGQPEVVYARISGWPGVFKSTQGGATWQFLPIGDGDLGAESLSVDPSDPKRVYVGVSGRVYASTDGGDTWPTYGQLVPPTQYADCNQFPKILLGIPGESGTVLAGVQHWCGSSPAEQKGSIYRSVDYGQHWDRVYPTNTLEISPVNDLAFDPASPLLVYAATGQGETDGGGILKSDDGGAKWYPIGAGEINSAKDVVVEPGTHRVFVTAGCCLPLYVSNDGGAHWAPTEYGGGHNVHDILFAPGNPPILYDAAQQGLYRSIDGAQSWQPAAGALGQVTVYALSAVTATNRVVLYAGTSGGLVTETTGTSVQADAGSTLVNAGVYRHTTLRLSWVYLPLVTRQQ